jgi:predicted transcriptional regulator
MDTIVAKTFRASDSGLGKVLGHLEESVMDSLWSRKEATGKEVLQDLSGRRKVAYTTVLTVLDRLHKKGLVKKERHEGGLLFSPAYTKAAFSAIVSREVMGGVIEMSQGLASAGFVNALAENDPKELDRLSKLIEDKKRELEEK